jgi:hypothetical protein
METIIIDRSEVIQVARTIINRAAIVKNADGNYVLTIEQAHHHCICEVPKEYAKEFADAILKDIEQCSEW